jgi:hypothetical protein
MDVLKVIFWDHAFQPRAAGKMAISGTFKRFSKGNSVRPNADRTSLESSH